MSNFFEVVPGTLVLGIFIGIVIAPIVTSLIARVVAILTPKPAAPKV